MWYGIAYDPYKWYSECYTSHTVSTAHELSVGRMVVAANYNSFSQKLHLSGFVTFIFLLSPLKREKKKTDGFHSDL